VADEQRSPDGGDPSNPGVRIERLPPLACWSLQAEPRCWPTLRLAAGLGDIAVPATGPWQASGPDLRWLQLGPQEAWLLPHPEPEANTAMAANPPLASTQAALRAQGLALACVAIGDAWVAWQLRGHGLLDLLAHGCLLDLGDLDDLGTHGGANRSAAAESPAPWGPSGCVRTRLAQAPAVIAFEAPTHGEPAVTLWTERSHAAYVDRWLETTQAALHHAMRAGTP
jgi:hypothetical protein